MKRPARIASGDVLAVVSLSSAAPHAFPHRFDAGLAQLAEALGVEVVEMPHARAPDELLDAHLELRAADLHAALRDKSIAGVVSSIGGEDSIRLLPHLDLELIAAHPKPFIGYSDSTVTHMAFHAAGVVSFYGPAVMAGFAENAGMHPYALEGVRRMLCGGEPPGSWPPNADGWTVEFLDWADPENQRRRRTLQPCTGWRWLQGRGTADGRCIAGCIEVLDWLRGTPVWPDLRGAVLALETSEEAPEPVAVTRMLRAIAAASDGLRDVRAVLFGRPGGSGLDPARHEEYDEAILRVVREELGREDLIVVAGLDFGHTDPIWTLPIGGRITVDADSRAITFPESVTAPA